MITRNLLSCCMYASAIGGSTNGGGVITFNYTRIFAGQSYGIRLDITDATSTGVSASAMHLYLAKTGKALGDLTEQEIYNPFTASACYEPKYVSSVVKSAKAEGSNLNNVLEYTFVIQNAGSTSLDNIDTIYVCSANTSSSSPANANLFVLSIHKLSEPITLAPLDTYQFKVSYDNLVIDVPSTIASA